MGIWEVNERAPGLDIDLTSLHAVADELLARGRDILDDHHHSLLRARLRLREPGADHDGAGRSGRGELHEAQLGLALVTVLAIPTNLPYLEPLPPLTLDH